MNKSVSFFDFSRYHGKYPDAGSTNIRVNQLLKYWPEANKYLFGQHPDVLIFQKVYCTPDYKFPKHYQGIKILDICDPDWLDGVTSIKETVDAVDAVTCSSDALRKFIKQMTNKPVITIADRFDLENIPTRKKHKYEARTVAWFGYRHNSDTLRPAMRLLNELNLNLLVISDDDPLAWQWVPARIDSEEYRKEKYTYFKYNEDTFYETMFKADFALLPIGSRPLDVFKSNNKTVKAILSGLPVAHDADDVRKFLNAEEREKYLDENYEKTKQEYDVKKSVEQYKELIDILSLTKTV